MDAHAELQASLGQLLLQLHQFFSLILGQGKAGTLPIEDHLIHQPLLLWGKYLPRFLDVCLSSLFGPEYVDAHGGLDSEVTSEDLGLVGGIAELLGWRDVLVERQGFDDGVGLVLALSEGQL